MTELDALLSRIANYDQDAARDAFRMLPEVARRLKEAEYLVAEAVRGAEIVNEELRELRAENQKIDQLHREVCSTLRGIVTKYHLGLGGEKMDELVRDYVDELFEKIEELKAKT